MDEMRLKSKVCVLKTPNKNSRKKPSQNTQKISPISSSKSCQQKEVPSIVLCSLIRVKSHSKKVPSSMEVPWT